MPTQITADLPTLNFPREVDYPTQEDWAAFSAAAEENFGILGGDWSTQMQLWKDQANAMSIESNNNADIAQAVANYQGDWVSQGYTLGQSVSVSGIYYICKLTHATGQNPTDVSSLYWNLALGNWSLKVDTNMSGYTSKTTPVDADLIPLSDSVSSFALKKLTLANLKTYTSPSSSETTSGIIELATTAEAQDGIDDLRAITPLKLRNALHASGTAPIYACRAWVNFNGTGTVAIRASGNVSSITDNGTGDYTANLIIAMPDANYATNGTGENAGTGTIGIEITTQLNNSVRIASVRSNGTSAKSYVDSSIINISINR